MSKDEIHEYKPKTENIFSSTAEHGQIFNPQKIQRKKKMD